MTFKANTLAYPSGVGELWDHASNKFPLDLVITVRGEYKESLKLFGERSAVEAVRKAGMFHAR